MAASSFPFRIDFPPELPISSRAEEIVATLQKHQVVILAGETGSGKTTQIPKMCLAAGGGQRGQIACTQPRRVAALSVSRRVAEELGVAWGQQVGCKIRFSDQTSGKTVIKFLTDGMLLAEVQGDPMLRAYDTIIIDEAHERSLNIDFLLGHLRQLRFKRPELKIVITSATIDTQVFSQAFDLAPVIEVSGRTYPVEVIYAPLDQLGSDAADGDEASSRSEALHYIDGAAEALERILRETTSGDVLIFLPAERDIRELRELLEGRHWNNCEIVPLFGRLSNAEQQRVFASSQRRKIVVATNIAETSLTIPGIKFVIDTGLARISRYTAQSRTRRLPIEEIAQSSADQRKGRCGRVAEGVCIRLYSEKDYLERPRFTQPEIQRANLADVILRMKAFGLGDIERFPFINMPASKAIRAGYALLEELGAVETEQEDESNASSPAPDHRLTPIGRELGRLPVDPTVGRMILQAREERCVSEVLVIAAGLSIQDPRERPMEAREKADAAHRRFIHPDSDFLTLLNIWDVFHEELESLSQAKLRRFCRDHFLSYTRMREWRDIHAQLVDVLSEREDFKNSSVLDGLSKKAREENIQVLLGWGTPSYRSIHRAILAGLLSNIAVRDEEAGNYKATHDRRIAIFPGSALFVRDDPKRKVEPRRDQAKKTLKAPRWIMAAEIMETTRLYARTSARLDPTWALDLASHIVRISHAEPFWNQDGGRILVKQRTRLYGLELESRAVSYGKIDPGHATELFIREALVNDTVTWPLDFLAGNRALRERIENLLTRARSGGYMNLDEAVYRFYAARLIDEPEADETFIAISSVADLVDLVRQTKPAQPDFLVMKEDDLRDPAELFNDVLSFPEALPLRNHTLPLNYVYKPGQPEDGVTLEVNVRDAELLTPAALDWAVPGHLQAKVEHYLRATPKELRRAFVPLSETARQITAALRDEQSAKKDARGPAASLPLLVEALAAEITRRFRIRVDPTIWVGKDLPPHLRVRVRVVDDEGREISANRELSEVKTAVQLRSRELSVDHAREDPRSWRVARERWEKTEQITWNFGDIPLRVQVAEEAGLPVLAYPVLRPEGTGVALRLLKTEEEATRAMTEGVEKLFEIQLRYELAWLEKDLKGLRELGALPATLTSAEDLQKQAHEMLTRWGTSPTRLVASQGAQGSIWKQTEFENAVQQAKGELRGVVPKLRDQLREILELRQSLLVHPQPYSGLSGELENLIPADFLRRTPYPKLPYIARYLRGMKVRSDRWKQNPAKDAERAKQLATYAAVATEISGKQDRALSEKEDAFRWLVEEFRVSLFAQELGTAEAVSPAKLDRVLAEIRGKAPAAGTAKIVSKPNTDNSPRAPLPLLAEGKKGPPVKSLGSLDSLFRRGK